MKTYNCLECDMTVYEGNYCRTCGVVLIPMPEVNCQCGKSISENDRYCTWCGIFLDTRQLPDNPDYKIEGL